MDVSEQYIKMCERAAEIQALWKPDTGDYVFCKVEVEPGKEREVDILSGDAEAGYRGHDRGSCPGYITIGYSGKRDFQADHIWLPRQDQSQDMVGYSVGTLVVAFREWCETARPVHADMKSQINLTMEQLWLAFVMKEKYNKVWNGEDWTTSQRDRRE